MSDKKGIASLIIGMSKKPKEDPEMESPMDSGSSDDEMNEGKSQAAQEILDAIDAKDASQLMTALENFIEMCDEK